MQIHAHIRTAESVSTSGRVRPRGAAPPTQIFYEGASAFKRDLRASFAHRMLIRGDSDVF